MSNPNSFMAKLKAAPKKNLTMGIICAVGVVALFVYFVLILAGVA